MRRTVTGPGAALAALLCAGVSAQGGTLRFCPGNAGGVCYSVGVPTSSAASGSGPIYFQISAPATLQWVALGTGTGMAGSNIFIMYQDGAGNVTLSPRIGANHVQPTLDTSPTAAQLTVLEGSGVSADGKTVTANVRCDNCESWNGGAGQLDLKDSQSSWVAAWRKGSPIDSTSRSVSLTQHDDTAIFELDLTRAAVAADANPFVGAAAATGSGSGDRGGFGGDDEADNGGDDDGGGVVVVSINTGNNKILRAHGIIMAIVWVVLYPLGALLMPVLGKWWAHGAFQTLVYALMWAGFGLGVHYAKYLEILFDQTHTLLGTCVVCLMSIQPLLGFAHHRYYVKNGGRGIISHVHIWYGRALMILGVINGGLGLQLVPASRSLKIAYGVVAGVIFVIYVAARGFFSFVRRKKGGGAAAPHGGDGLGGGAARKTEGGSGSPA